MRNLATKVENKRAISEAGAIKELLGFLDSGEDNALTIVAAETLCCLAADDLPNMVGQPGIQRSLSTDTTVLFSILKIMGLF